MQRRRVLQYLAAASFLRAQDGKPAADAPLDYVCPMDPDVRASKPGACPRCGMKLVLGIPDGTEFRLELRTRPEVFHSGQKVKLLFRVVDPRSGKAVERFEIVHEKLFHMFIVSQDLEFFIHDHPQLEGKDLFRFEAVFPKAGLYRILGDIYPAGATPQLIAKTVIVRGGPADALRLQTAKLAPQLGPSHCANMDVELVTDPLQPLCGMKTMMFFKLKPSEGMEKYLGAWGHMLAASDDLIDLIHTHPFIADGGAQEQFNLIFPRARPYRVWVQFQREGVVNTAMFTVPVSELK